MLKPPYYSAYFRAISRRVEAYPHVRFATLGMINVMVSTVAFASDISLGKEFATYLIGVVMKVSDIFNKIIRISIDWNAIITKLQGKLLLQEDESQEESLTGTWSILKWWDGKTLLMYYDQASTTKSPSTKSITSERSSPC